MNEGRLVVLNNNGVNIEPGNCDDCTVNNSDKFPIIDHSADGADTLIVGVCAVYMGTNRSDAFLGAYT